MADLHVTWMKLIKLAKVKGLSLVIDGDDLPTTGGVYMFFRRRGTNTTEVIYVGKATNFKQRLGWHANNHALILAMLAKPGGTCYLMPGEFKAKTTQKPEDCIATIERVLIRKCIEDGHPLINVKGSRIRTQHVISTLPAGAKFLSKSIVFEPQAKKAAPAPKFSANKGRSRAG